MPYLNDDFKSEVDSACSIKKATSYSSNLKPKDYAGFLNYRNYKDITVYLNKNPKMNRYWVFALILGSLLCCMLEVYRRIIAPYEDKAIEKNGDVK